MSGILAGDPPQRLRDNMARQIELKWEVLLGEGKGERGREEEETEREKKRRDRKCPACPFRRAVGKKGEWVELVF